MKHFSDIIYRPGIARVVLIHGDPIRFTYDMFSWFEKGIQFKISCCESSFIPYEAISYIQFEEMEVEDDAQT